jgi:hypothetical protein
MCADIWVTPTHYISLCDLAGRDPFNGFTGGGKGGGGADQKPKKNTTPLKPTPTPTPQKTQQQKQSEYENCFHKEMAPTMRQLDQLMHRGLRNTIIAGVGGGSITSLVKLSAGGIGISIGVLGGLFQWRDQIEDFGRDKLEPAQAAAKEKCKKEAGL